MIPATVSRVIVWADGIVEVYARVGGHGEAEERLGQYDGQHLSDAWDSLVLASDNGTTWLVGVTGWGMLPVSRSHLQRLVDGFRKSIKISGLPS